MHDDIKKILIDEDIIAKRLDTMAQKIMADFEGSDLTLVCLLNGAIVITADLFRRLDKPLRIECLKVSSYHGGTESSGTVNFLDSQLPDVKGKSLLVIDDILDTGLTLHAVKAKLTELGATSIKSCVLLAKDREREAEVDADYVGFVIDNEFVVGYGLDYNGHYRNLPYIGILKEEAYPP